MSGFSFGRFLMVSCVDLMVEFCEKWNEPPVNPANRYRDISICKYLNISIFRTGRSLFSNLLYKP